MRATLCGCTTSSCDCGCCDGGSPATPVTTWNAPGLPKLIDRVGTHGQFLASMKARLATMSVDGVGADGQTVETFRPLQGLTARDTSDFSIALLDSWASVGDVLTFYQERITNEGYLRSATERRSVVELARLVGYAPRPGVAATVFLSYDIDASQVEAANIPVGSAAQSTPGPGEMPQTFETVEALDAKADWNDLPVRRARPQVITFADALTINEIYLAGAVVLRAGDLLLLAFGDDDQGPFAVRAVASTENQAAENQTLVHLQPVTAEVFWRVAALVSFITDAKASLAHTPDPDGQRLMELVQARLDETYLGYSQSVIGDNLIRAAGDVLTGEIRALYARLRDKLARGPGHTVPSGPVLTTPSQFVGALLTPAQRQASNALQLGRSLIDEFAAGRDTSPRMLLAFSPQLKDSFYQAWAGASVNAAIQPLRSLAVFRASAPLFGAFSNREPTFDDDGILRPPPNWAEWSLADDEDARSLYLDQAYDGVVAGGWAMIQVGDGVEAHRRVRQVADVRTVARSAYGLNGKSTVLTTDADWWTMPVPGVSPGDADMATLRSTLVYAQSEALTLAGEPMTDVVSGQEIELAGLYAELKSGRWIVLSGERADIASVSGVQASELMMVSGLRHGYDPALPGDVTHTTLILATKTAYAYKRDTLQILANVVKATHGETRRETLGAGDGTTAFQEFDLRLPPLTYVSAPTPSGVASTLQVSVNDVYWKGVDSFADQDPKARIFVTRIDDDGTTSITFGDGITGARPATGLENVQAVYRQGIGAGGNVKAEQVNLLMARPLGVRSVINPLRASGGADREDRDSIRANAPLAIGALDRLVSLSDYGDFARTFAGVGKAAAAQLSDGRRELVQITIAGVDDIPIDTTSDVYNNLLTALRTFGDPSLPVRVDVREAVMLVLSAKLSIAADRKWEVVVQAVRDTLADLLGFRHRNLAEPVMLGPIIAAIQDVPGVVYVDVDAFGGVPERRVAETGGSRRLLTLDEISDAVQAIVDPGAAKLQSAGGVGGMMVASGKAHAFAARGVAQVVRVNAGGLENGGVRPAQIAMLSPDLPETLVLNQIP